MMCMTELHGGVCHRTSTPHKSGNKMKEKKKCYRELTVSIIVSAIAVFRLVDNTLSSTVAVFTARQIVHCPIYKLDSRANSTRDTGTVKNLEPLND